MGERGLQRPDKGHKVDIRAECLKGLALELLDTVKLGRGMNCNEWVGETNTEAEPSLHPFPNIPEPYIHSGRTSYPALMGSPASAFPPHTSCRTT